MKENKLIAEFLGKDHELNQCISAPQFHKSWDWLMPVIQKCLIGEAEQSEDISNLAIKNIYEGICNQDISLAYQSVVQFINNKNK